MTLTLRDYQQAALDGLYDYWATGRGDNPLIVAPTGSGKSLLIAKIIEDALSFTGTRVLVLTHVAELLKQNRAELHGVLPFVDSAFYSAGIGQKNLEARVIFGGIQSIWRRAFDMVPAPDLCIVDECFVGDTMVATPSGPKRIDQVTCGDTILSVSGMEKVLATSCRAENETYLVNISDGTSIECTGNHPFLTWEGWTEARALGIGQVLFSEQDVSALWQHVQTVEEACEREIQITGDERGKLDKAEILLRSLCEEIVTDPSRSASEAENQSSIEREASQAYQTWRERAIASFAAIGATSCSGRRLGSGGSHQNERWPSKRSLSELLQGGYSKYGKESGDRTGRREPFVVGAPTSGQEENGLSGPLRVESISRIKRESPVPVFNIHVTGHPSYFANGVAVHNCHLIPKNTETRYGKFLADLRIANPDMKLIGLTATPYRLDSGYLHKGEGALFDGVAYDIPVGKLIDDGWLAPVVAKAGKREIDLTDVHIRGGEFIESELAAAASDPELVRAVVSEIIAKGADRKSWLVFASGVDHAHMIQAEMAAQGEESVVITGDLNKTDRASRIEDFKRGDVRCLINVNVLTTGFNHPPIDLVAMVRATMSAGLYVQVVGRGMRTAPGKEDCLLLDYGSNVLRHGFIDRVRPKDKSASQGGDAPVKKCPDCEALLPTAVLECPSCGHKFPPPELNHDRQAYDGAVVSTQVQAEWVDVDSVTYARHQKSGKPDSIRVTYHCGLMEYREWLCPDHGGFAASKYWARMKSLEADATTTDAALAEAPLFWTMPSRIKVRPRAENPNWHEIVQLDYSGGRKPPPRGESIDWTNPNAWNDLIRTDYDDEIPF